MKRIFAVLLSLVLLFCVSFGVSAEKTTEVYSTDLVVFVNALFGKIVYDTEWLDINSDGNVNIVDLICLKKKAAGIEPKNYKPLKSVTITYNYADRTETVKQYTSECILPTLSSGYWKNGASYFNPESIINIYDNTTFTYSKNKSIDTPIIPLG